LSDFENDVDLCLLGGSLLGSGFGGCLGSSSISKALFDLGNLIRLLKCELQSSQYHVYLSIRCCKLCHKIVGTYNAIAGVRLRLILMLMVIATISLPRKDNFLAIVSSRSKDSKLAVEVRNSRHVSLEKIEVDVGTSINENVEDDSTEG